MWSEAVEIKGTAREGSFVRDMAQEPCQQVERSQNGKELKMSTHQRGSLTCKKDQTR